MLLLAATPLSASGPVDFEAEVLPILESKCLTCHGAKQQYSNLRLDSRSGILRGGELGPVLEPERPEESSLYVRTSLPPDDLDTMPVDDEPLTRAEQSVIRQWIVEGARFGTWTGADD